MKKTYSKKRQRLFYDNLCKNRDSSKALFSCGFEERFDPDLIVNDPSTFKFFDSIISKIIGVEKCMIIECCTGSGQLLPVLHAFSDRLVGIDISFELLLKAKIFVDKLGLDHTALVQSEAENLPIKSDSFDVIVIVDSLHHVENQIDTIKEIKRIARDNATLILIEPNVMNPLVFLAHAIPSEERGALRTNTAAGFKRLLSPYVSNIQIYPTNYIASRKSSKLGQWISNQTKKTFNCIFPFWPIRLIVQATIRK